MTIEAKKLDTINLAIGDLSVELDAIQVLPFICATAINMIEFQDSVIFDTACDTSTAQGFDGSISCWTQSSAIAIPRQFLGSLRVPCLPLINSWFGPNVFAVSTDTALWESGVGATVDAKRSVNNHIENTSMDE